MLTSVRAVSDDVMHTEKSPFRPSRRTARGRHCAVPCCVSQHRRRHHRTPISTVRSDPLRIPTVPPLHQVINAAVVPRCNTTTSGDPVQARRAGTLATAAQIRATTTSAPRPALHCHPERAHHVCDDFELSGTIGNIHHEDFVDSTDAL